MAHRLCRRLYRTARAQWRHQTKRVEYREGKITRLLEWLDQEGENLEGASFYSDSRNDSPLLRKADFPHAVNPNGVLKEAAEKAG